VNLSIFSEIIICISRHPRLARVAARFPRFAPPENRRSTGGLSSIPHRREMLVTINAGNCVPSPQEAPIRYAIMPGGSQGAMMAIAESFPIEERGAAG